jgi:hypothetical protein
MRRSRKCFDKGIVDWNTPYFYESERATSELCRLDVTNKHTAVMKGEKSLAEQVSRRYSRHEQHAIVADMCRVVKSSPRRNLPKWGLSLSLKVEIK